MIYGQLLVFALLIAVELRVFFVKQAKKDSLVFLAPLCVVLSILLIFAWNLNITNIIVLILSVLVFIVNIYSLVKYMAKLLTDSYSPLSKSLAIIFSLLGIGGIIFTLLFVPVNINNKKLEITETTEYYEGNFRTGFTPIKPLSKTNAILKTFTPSSQETTPEKIVLVVPDKRGDSESYTPYMKFLAKAGYTVCSLDVYTDDCDWFGNSADNKVFRRFFMVESSFHNSPIFENSKDTFKYNMSRECDTAITLLKEKYGSKCQFFLVGDGMSSELVTEYAEKNTSAVLGSFTLDSISEYKTSGFGCVEQTDTLVAKRLDQKRDKDSFITKYLVLKSSEAIKKAFGDVL